MLYFLFSLAITVFDQLFKKWILATIPLHGELPFIPGLLHLTYIKNTGAAFSFLQENPVFLTVFNTLLSIGVAVYIIKGNLGKIEKISLSAVLGGAIGNLVDRFTLGFVVDMFEVEFMNFAVFNVADCFIVCGGILFCIVYIIKTAEEEKAKKLTENTNDSDA